MGSRRLRGMPDVVLEAGSVQLRTMSEIRPVGVCPMTKLLSPRSLSEGQRG